MRKESIYISLCTALVAVFALWASSGEAYTNYSPGCSQCHPAFIGPGSALHDLHEPQMTATCLLCHTTVGDNPSTNSSGDPAGQGCRGCHGVNPDPGGPANNLWGAGLRLHHANAGVPPDGNGLTCSSCHPGDPVPPPSENTVPLYYSRADVNVKDPCSASPAPPGEDFSGNGLGLDNDGNLLYDANDPACQPAPVCGNGILETGEQCDAGAANGTTVCGCQVDCTYTAAGISCSDGLFCNGQETCDGAGVCQPGTNPCPAGTICNEATATCEPAPVCGNGVIDPGEQCDSGVANGTTVCGCQADCTFTPAGTSCTDGLFCNGLETCDGLGVCQPGTNPCPPETPVCIEATDTCEPVQPLCGNGVLDPGEQCDAGAANGTTVCGCQADCTFTPAGTSCTDGLFCNGLETCDGLGVCQPGTNPCTTGTVCNETTDTCEPQVKVTICHIPPGNPAKARTITIDAASVADHLAHGDSLGSCP